MRKETVEKIVAIADNSGREVEQFEIDSVKPFDENWQHLGDDYFESMDGVCGPSGGDRTRTFVPFGHLKENIPFCPVCNGGLKETGSAGDDCLCFPNEVKEYFGL